MPKRVGKYEIPSRAYCGRFNFKGTQQQQLIGELSGGQLQRVFLARVLAQEAELLLMDEPLTGLDLPSQELILGLIDRIRRQGVTVLVASHDLNQAGKQFPLILLLNRRVIAFGFPEQVLTTANLLAAFHALVRQ